MNLLKNHSGLAVIGGEAGFDEKGNLIAAHGVKFRFMKNYVIDERDYTLDKNNIMDVDVVDASNFMIRRSLFFEMGGFDPGYQYPHEDSDLCLRLKNKGYQIGVHINSAALHKRASSSRMPQIYFVSKARVRYQIKNFGFFKTNFFNVLDRPLVVVFLEKVKTLCNVKGCSGGNSYAKENGIVNKIYNTPLQYYSAYNKDAAKSLPIYIVAFLFFYYLAASFVWNIFHLVFTIQARRNTFLGMRKLLGSIRTSETI